VKRRIALLLCAALALSMGGVAVAGSSDSQTVSYEVQAINEIVVSGDPGALAVSTATAGSQPDEVSDASTTYDITTNGTNKKITAVLNTAMPANVTLKVALVAPTGGSSEGDVTLSNVAADVVTGITQKAEGSKTITYKLSALVTAGIVASATKTVTLTIADG
jgi:hypothetical protein